MFAEPEFDGVAGAVDPTIEIHPLSADLDVRLVDMPSAGHDALVPIEALLHHFLQVAQAQAVAQIPADAKQDH